MTEATFPIVDTHGYVWDSDTLTYVREEQALLHADTITVSMAGVATSAGQATGNATLAAIDVSTAKLQLTPASGSVSGIGNNTLITPSAGKKLRLSYLSANPALAVELGFRLGAAGTLFLRNSLAAGSVVAKDFGDMRYLEGAVNEPLVLNLSLGVATIWNALYVEV